MHASLMKQKGYQGRKGLLKTPLCTSQMVGVVREHGCRLVFEQFWAEGEKALPWLCICIQKGKLTNTREKGHHIYSRNSWATPQRMIADPCLRDGVVGVKGFCVLTKLMRLEARGDCRFQPPTPTACHIVVFRLVPPSLWCYERANVFLSYIYRAWESLPTTAHTLADIQAQCSPAQLLPPTH